MDDGRWRALSLWMDGVAETLEPRPALDADLVVDVAIVGAGFTGLWTAYYLAAAKPSLSIAVLDKHIAGFGASGRNGGWCSALFAASREALAGTGGAAAVRQMQEAMNATVDEVGSVAAAEGIECGYTKGGTLVVARSAAQATRLRADIEVERKWGTTVDDLRWLSAAEATSRVSAQGVLGGTFTPHCASLDPARLVRGLAGAAERRGVRIFEQSPALRIAPGAVDTPAGRLRAPVVIRATEGFTATLPGHHRRLAPVYSLMIATEPLPPSFWDSVGWRSRETLSDGRHLIVYAQRTEDDRIAFGGRGAPYHFGSRVHSAYDRDADVFGKLRAALVGMFPAAADAQITHQWGGPLGVPRDWYSSVGFDPATGLGWAGGYVGDGVSTTNLAGRTLRDLICGRRTELTTLPWVGHHSPLWEPEPVRWLGINAGRRLMAGADASEARTGRPSRRAQWMGRFVGH
ncbi:MAG: FAD-dependent oxidoreductase [Mycobacteriales bacterium]